MSLKSKAPPTLDFCVGSEPNTANIRLNEKSSHDGDCIEVYPGETVTIEAAAKGYRTIRTGVCT